MDAVREQQHRPLAAYQGFVRSQLSRFGASHSDLEDLIQEVWLIAIARSPRFTEDRAIRAWLSEVCRRVVAGARRSRTRTPLLPGDAPELSVEPEQVEHIEVELDEQMCMAALARLDERQLDVLTLYGGGDLSMREVAELVGEPERTVYSRYRSAISELTRDLRRNERTKPRSSLPPPFPLSDTLNISGDSEIWADQGRLAIYRSDERMVLGRLGNVVVARWRKRAYEDSSLAIGRAIGEAHKRMGGLVVLLNHVEPEMRLLNASERSYMRELIRVSSPQLAVVVDVCNTPIVRIGGAIMQALMLITRSTTSFVVVPTLEQTRRHVTPHAFCTAGPLSFEQVAHAMQTLRSQP
ncbi:MAG: sigma-70 family RNA polymerase sigma factor [Myxococcales bacterium]